MNEGTSVGKPATSLLGSVGKARLFSCLLYDKAPLPVLDGERQKTKARLSPCSSSDMAEKENLACPLSQH